MPQLSRLAFRVKSDGLVRAFILDGLDREGEGNMRRDVLEDGEWVYQGFLEGCGLGSGMEGGWAAISEGGRTEGRTFRLMRNGGLREVEEGETRSDEERTASSVEWAACEVGFGEVAEVVEMELDDLPM
jgi:hypothetical protein